MRSNKKNTTQELETYIQSMSCVGRCIDNGLMENFCGITKEEMHRLKTYETCKELENDKKQYIEFYNAKRDIIKMGLRSSA